jgi:oxygen-dependent protoporphyrinogen oxidase
MATHPVTSSPLPHAGDPADRVVVVGAGIAGLSAAFRLREAGFEVTVLEADDRVGGRISTVEHAGYRIDNGASLLTTAYRQMVRLISDAGLDSEVQPTDSTFGIIRDGRVHAMASDSSLDGLRTGLLSARAKIRLVPMIWDVLRARDKLDYADFAKAAPLDTESLRTYAQRRTNSSEVIDYLVEPLSIGFFGAGADVVSRVGFMFGLKNFIFGGSYFNSSTGIDFLPKGLARGLDVRTGARVTEVKEHPGGVRVSWESEAGAHVDEAAAAVIAVPAPAMLGMHPGLDAQRRAIVERIEYGRGVTVSFGLADPPPAPCTLVLVPPCEHPDLLAILYEHRKAPGRAPRARG